MIIETEKLSLFKFWVNKFFDFIIIVLVRNFIRTFMRVAFQSRSSKKKVRKNVSFNILNIFDIET